MRIECPARGGCAEQCNWITRAGSVRDRPSTGIIECHNCQLVTHSNDLSQSVNYENGTMHEWASGYGDTLPGPSTDITRRITSIKNLDMKYKIESILDFGCGSGGMISALSPWYETLGIEPDLQARELANQQGSKVYESSELALYDGLQVDVVTLFHVVEHFYDPSIELQRIHNILRPGGLMIIETPNSYDALLTEYENLEFQNFTYWSHHPMLHSHKSLQAMVERNNFTVIENLGTQRYNLTNHLYWLAKGLPAGHEVWNGKLSGDAIESYARSLVANKTCDTLWLLAQKNH